MPKTDLTNLTATEYQALARRLDRRHGPDQSWSELPIIRRPGRPRKGTTAAAPLKPKSVKLPEAIWKALAIAAKRHGVTASGVVAGLALQAASQDELDRAIDRLINEGILTPS